MQSLFLGLLYIIVILMWLDCRKTFDIITKEILNLREHCGYVPPRNKDYFDE